MVKLEQFAVSRWSTLNRGMHVTVRCFGSREKYNSPFTKLWQSWSDPHLKIRPIEIFSFYSLNYSLAARLQDNSRPKSPIKVETKRKLQQFTVSGWLIMNGGESGNKKKKTLKLKLHSI